MKTIAIKMLTNRGGTLPGPGNERITYSVCMGDIVEWPENEAKRLIASGEATAADKDESKLAVSREDSTGVPRERPDRTRRGGPDRRAENRTAVNAQPEGDDEDMFNSMGIDALRNYADSEGVSLGRAKSREAIITKLRAAA